MVMSKVTLRQVYSFGKVLLDYEELLKEVETILGTKSVWAFLTYLSGNKQTSILPIH